MEGQMMLTNYFTVAKRQTTHPAKRRKVIADIEGTAKKSAKLVDEKCVNLSEGKVLMNGSCKTHSTMASSMTKHTSRSSRTRNAMRSRNIAQNKIVSDGVVAVTTSVKDDHEASRSRKQTVSESPVSSVINHSPTPVDPPTAVQAKAIPEESKIERPTSESSEKTSSESRSGTKEGNISSQSRTGLKPNPWITEQAKLVLSSRGKQALEKSLGQQKTTSNSSKVTSEKPRSEVKEQPKVERAMAAVRRKANVARLNEGISTATGKSNSRGSGPSVPAYKRFSHLLEAKKPKPSGVTKNLPLPYHYKVLEEMFRCVDVVLSLKQKRYETCTFERLKDAVQEMCRKKFEKKHLAQINAVYPTAFLFHQQSGLSGPRKYQLTIDFNFTGSENQIQAKDFKFIESSVLNARQKHFKQELLKITMKHHRQYLAKNYPTLTVDDDAIMRWHPCFPLDEIPEIDLSPLPEPPKQKTYTSAQDVLDQARQNMTPRMEKALNLAAKKSAESSNVKLTVDNVVLNKTSQNQMKNNASLKGVSQSLIDKIREKEEKKIQESLTVNSEVVEKRVMAQRFPELCRILKTYFVSEKKPAIPLEDVKNKLAESYTSSLSSVEVEKHVKLLSEVLPEWLSILYVRKCPYVKLKKNANINMLIEKLKSKEVN